MAHSETRAGTGDNGEPDGGDLVELGAKHIKTFVEVQTQLIGL